MSRCIYVRMHREFVGFDLEVKALGWPHRKDCRLSCFFKIRVLQSLKQIEIGGFRGMKREVKSVFRGVLFLSFLALLLSGVTLQAQAAPSSFESPKYGFSFTLPDGWSIGDPKIAQGTAAIAFSDPQKGEVVNFNVVVSPAQGVEKITESQLKETYRAAGLELKNLLFKKGKFQGSPSLHLEYELTQEGVTLKQRQYMVDHKGKGLTLTFTGSKKAFENNQKAFETIVNSFKF